MKKTVKIVCIVLGVLVTVVCWVVLARAVFFKTFDVAKGTVTKDILFDGEWLDKEVTLKKVE